MVDIWSGLVQAAWLVGTLDAELLEIALRSLKVTLSALVIASLIALPLYVPTAIFGALAMGDGPSSAAAPLFLAASTLFALAVAPFAMGAALRLAAD